MRSEAWIAELSAADLQVGAQFSGARAAALHTALRDAAVTIVRMPATQNDLPRIRGADASDAHQERGLSSGALPVDAAYLPSTNCGCPCNRGARGCAMLTNMAYNMRRWCWLDGRSLPA